MLLPPPDRLNRDLTHPFGSEGYAREELRAEIASLILGSEVGLGYDPGQHAGYVDHWVQILTDTPTEILYAAADAEKISEYEQYERSQRAPDRCLFGAAPQRREEPAQRTSAFLSSREENGEDRCWSAALRLDRLPKARAAFLI